MWQIFWCWWLCLSEGRRLCGCLKDKAGRIFGFLWKDILTRFITREVTGCCVKLFSSNSHSFKWHHCSFPNKCWKWNQPTRVDHQDWKGEDMIPFFFSFALVLPLEAQFWRWNRNFWLNNSDEHPSSTAFAWPLEACSLEGQCPHKSNNERMWECHWRYQTTIRSIIS